MTIEHAEWPPRFQFASEVWPGLAKLSEECGEVVQVVGKIIGTGGTMKFRDGSVVERERLIEELADLDAILKFVVQHNLGREEKDRFDARSNAKGDLFWQWRRAEREERP